MAKLARQRLTEHESYWSLPIKGLRLIQLRLDHAFGMVIGEADSEFSIRINVPFKLKDSEGIADYSVDQVSEIGPALLLFNTNIVDAKAFKNGRLELTFSTNRILSVEPDSQFEAWEVLSNNTNGMRVIGMPNDELAIWSDPQNDVSF